MRAQRQGGFTMVELIIVMGLTVIVMGMASKVLVSMVSQYKQQSKVAESSIEGYVGLDILRRDITAAGHGLPVGIQNSTNAYKGTNFDLIKPEYYQEMSSDGQVAKTFNNYPNPPKPIASGKPSINKKYYAVNDSDYLVLRGVSLGDTAAAGKFHLLSADRTTNLWQPKVSDAYRDLNLRTNDWAIVLSMKDEDQLGLVLTPSPMTDPLTKDKRYAVKLDNNPPAAIASLAAFVPTDPKDSEKRIVYGITTEGVGANMLRAPFNRADYFVASQNSIWVSELKVPTRCAPNTGVLVKSVMQHLDGKHGEYKPLVDCVALFRVYYGLHTSSDASDRIDTYTNDISGLSARQIQEQVRDVRVYILTHEGQKDLNYDWSAFGGPSNTRTTITVGEDLPGAAAEPFNLSIKIGLSYYKNYRWKLIRLSVKPMMFRLRPL